MFTRVVCATALLAGSALPASPSPLEAATQAAPQPPGNPAPQNLPAPAGGQRPPAKPAAPDDYAYDARGRRDPFINLRGTVIEPRLSSKRGEGAAGWTVAEISVRGIVQSRGALVAMVRGPDNMTFLVHPGDKFLDGTVKTITPQGLVIVQEVNDPLSLVKQREIRKQLRTLEDTKP
jgi:Tfp pilus assembly protein PilP